MVRPGLSVTPLEDKGVEDYSHFQIVNEIIYLKSRK